MTCCNCTAETTNGLALCGRCQQTLRVALVNTAAYYADVDRIRPGDRVKTRSAYQSAPPTADAPIRDTLGEALEATTNTAVSWARVLIDDRPNIGSPPRTTTALLGWLESNVASIATLEWAGALIRDVRANERTLRSILDQTDTGWYAGVCGNQLGTEVVDGETVPVRCERSLYGSRSSAWVRCPECGRTWDAAARRDTMMREARDRTAPVSVIARACIGLLDHESSVERLANRIDQWVRRGRLRDLGVRVLEDGKPHRVYRLGDVFDLLGVERKDHAPRHTAFDGPYAAGLGETEQAC